MVIKVGSKQFVYDALIADMVGLRFGENPRQVATLADLRVRGKGKKRRAAVGCSGLVTRQRSIIRGQKVHMPWKGDVHVPQDQVRAR